MDYKDKITSQEVLSIIPKDKTIVFTNGCFDLLHPGHIAYLFEAKTLGDILVIGVNSDKSVQILKGISRPINPLQDRMLMLASLQCVDYIVAFDEETPLELIQKIKPHILVKGGDYLEENIVGANFVKDKGGMVKVIPFLEGYSSSKIIEKIKKS